MRLEPKPYRANPYLTEQQYWSYHENGFLVVDDMFSAPECDEMLEICERNAESNFPAILNLDRKEPRLRDYMKNDRGVGIMETLQGCEIVGTMSQILFKKVGTQYAGQAWNPHQDNAYPQNPNGAYLTINIALKAQDRENGCLYIFPGSHKEGLYPCEPTQSYREIAGTNPGNTVASHIVKRFTHVDLPMKQGAALFLHGDVVHGSYPNVSANRSRPMMQFTYINRGEVFVPGRNANRMEIPLH